MLNSTQRHGLPICDILGLYHVLMYVCRLHWFVVPQFFCLYGLPTYVECLYPIPTNVELLNLCTIFVVDVKVV